MPSFDSASHQIREFSLAELVAKITQLERRQQVRSERNGEQNGREGDRRSGESTGQREGDFESGQELTE
jgi:hypothetical protein